MKEKNIEEKLIEMIKFKEQRDKELLMLEIFIMIISSIILLGSIFIVSFSNLSDLLTVLIVILGIIIFTIGIIYAIRIEQIAGYYECNCCHYKYVPTYKSVFWSMHVCRIRYMKCPKCSKWSWQRKRISK